MYLVRTPNLIQKLFPRYTWQGPLRQKPTVYLTFDDGPIPEITPWVLQQLGERAALGTFFCVGENAERHPDLLRRIRAAGHAVGNHTHNHLSGWESGVPDYVRNVRRCAGVVQSDLFRPPYGRLRPRQASAIHPHFKVVMWDVLSGDFDPGLSPDDCLGNVLDNVQDGSIVVFHDSLKSERNLRYALPRVLESLGGLGYTFGALSGANPGLAQRADLLHAGLAHEPT